jgi:hypothetical protein
MGRALVVIRSDTDRRKATEITLEVLKALLRYDPADGAFYRQDGTRAGTKRRDGYRQIVIGGRQYLEHRLAWFHETGDWPPHSVDHIDRDRSNNRIANLRPATQSQNGANSKLRADSTSGLKGVTWDKANNKWVAHVMVGRRAKKLGRFKTKEEAHAVYLKAAAEIFGEFVRPA